MEESESLEVVEAGIVMVGMRWGWGYPDMRDERRQIDLAFCGCIAASLAVDSLYTTRIDEA